MKTDDDGDDSILEQVMDFCLSSGFEQRFRDFADRHARTFAHADMEEEHPMSWHEAYQEYLKEFEGYIAGACISLSSGTLAIGGYQTHCWIDADFIVEQGSSLQEFYRQAKAALRDDELSSRRFFVEALLACTEYSEFVSLMREEAEEVQEAKAQGRRK